MSENHEFKHALGLKVKDKITGFTGIIVYRVEYQTGCDQYGVQPPIGKEGKIPDSHQFDEMKLEVVGKGVSLEPAPEKASKNASKSKTGGPNYIVNQ